MSPAIWLGRITALSLLLIASGCSTNVSRFQMPGADLADVKRVYLRPLIEERQASEIQSLVESHLTQRGYEIARDPATAESAPGTYAFDMTTDWYWDVTWYLLELRVAIYDPRDDTLVAQAQSMQTSLSRRSTEVIVERAMQSLFNDTQTLNGEE
ncbi:MAG: hypothetical protein AB8G16_11785 [Gammaproteobacteria bacterium]